uniref:C3H1-type domain-containing protein n=1 Tax=Haemonchus placei TaxID=6290 RepID=A0A0N4X2I6_HAEPC
LVMIREKAPSRNEPRWATYNQRKCPYGRKQTSCHFTRPE